MSREGLIPQLQAHSIQVTALKYTHQSISVYQGMFQDNAATIKVMTLAPGGDYTQLEKECRILMSLSHPNIIQVYDCFWEHTGTSFFYVIVTEWCEKDLAKDMQQRVADNDHWEEETLLNLAYELVSALAYMQEQGISHRDIKPENIFLTSTKSAKLGDFGSVHTFQSDIESTTQTIAPFYLSPKLRNAFMNRTPQVVHNSFKSDVFSLGLTLITLIHLAPPQSLAKFNLSNEEVLAEINTTPCSVLFKSMLASMLSVDEDLRYDFKVLKGWIIPKSKESGEAGCMKCGKAVDRCSETALCEVVQLYCEPLKHMFCSRECCRAFLSLGSSKCPQCGVDIPNETVVWCQTESIQDLDLPSGLRPEPKRIEAAPLETTEVQDPMNMSGLQIVRKRRHRKKQSTWACNCCVDTCSCW